MTKRVRIIVSGKVQGVFFRASTQKKAEQLRIVGFAKNLPDGRVEIVADGEHSSIEQLIAWSHTGPPMARVKNVILTETQNSEFFDYFEIR